MLSLAFALLCGGCTDNVTPETAERGIKLTVSVPGAGEKTGITTKADTIDGEDDFNENVLNSVYYFFYKLNVTDQKPEISGYFTDLKLNEVGATKTWTIPASANTITNKLFPAGSRECSLFVVANPPASLVSLLEGTPTLSELRNASFSTNLLAEQSSFVMVYDGTAELTSRTDVNAVTGDAKLRRLANKFTIKANVANSYTDTATNYVWEPRLEGLRVEFYNAMGKTNLGADFDALKSNPGVTDDDYFDVTPGIGFGDAVANGTDHMIATSESSFYSYTMKWDFTDKYEPFILIELPWQNMSSGTHPIQSCFYKMMLSDKSIATNGWYNITIDLSVLGSFYKTAPTQQYLYEDYLVLDWNNAFEATINNVDAEIKEARYLVTNQTSYTVNNQSRLSIPFSSSHECDFEVISATKANYTTLGHVPDNYTTAAANWFSFNGSVLEFNHTLNNTLGSTMDITPYEIDVKIYHKGAEQYNETIHITQYPAVFITQQINSDPEAGNRTNNSATNVKGYTYVNNNQERDGNYAGIYGTYRDGTVNNPNMTIITVSQFEPGMTYILGDPRSTTVDNNLGSADNTWSVEAPGGSATGTERRLTNYYPTRTGITDTAYIAPKLRIVSSYSRHGSGSSISYDNARKRCASWQEDGYPAGRWRLPTKSEVRYITTLSSLGIIPPIFYTNQYYWYATGRVRGSIFSDGTTGYNTNAYTRCVYDEWYWDAIDKAAGNDHSAKTFYWGDQPR